MMDRKREADLLKQWLANTTFDELPDEEIPDLDPEEDDED